MKTKRTQIVNNLRMLWLYSKERAQCLKDASYSCQRCGVKQSKAVGKVQKVEVHHKEGVLNWDEIEEVIRKHLLCDVEDLECLCPTCHKKETYGES
jgi:predicted HNH restriction endonuclease